MSLDQSSADPPGSVSPLTDPHFTSHYGGIPKHPSSQLQMGSISSYILHVPHQPAQSAWRAYLAQSRDFHVALPTVIVIAVVVIKIVVANVMSSLLSLWPSLLTSLSSMSLSLFLSLL